MFAKPLTLPTPGATAEWIVYPGQFHGFTRPSFIKDRYARWMNCYDKYLDIAPVPASASAPAAK